MPESASTQTLSKPSSSNPSPVNGSSTTLLGKGKVDPYYLITHVSKLFTYMYAMNDVLIKFTEPS